MNINLSQSGKHVEQVSPGKADHRSGGGLPFQPSVSFYGPGTVHSTHNGCTQQQSDVTPPQPRMQVAYTPRNPASYGPRSSSGYGLRATSNYRPHAAYAARPQYQQQGGSYYPPSSGSSYNYARPQPQQQQQQGGYNYQQPAYQQPAPAYQQPAPAYQQAPAYQAPAAQAYNPPAANTGYQQPYNPPSQQAYRPPADPQSAGAYGTASGETSACKLRRLDQRHCYLPAKSWSRATPGPSCVVYCCFPLLQSLPMGTCSCSDTARGSKGMIGRVLWQQAEACLYNAKADEAGDTRWE